MPFAQQERSIRVRFMIYDACSPSIDPYSIATALVAKGKAPGETQEALKQQGILLRASLLLFFPLIATRSPILKPSFHCELFPIETRLGFDVSQTPGICET